MLGRSGPFVYLGPGCPTLYYPRNEPSSAQPGPRQTLPSFIVHRKAIQPNAFILSTVRPLGQEVPLVSQDPRQDAEPSHSPFLQPPAVPMPSQMPKINEVRPKPIVTASSKRKFPVMLLSRGQGGKRRTGVGQGGRMSQEPGSEKRVLDSCAQTDWLLDTRHNWVFVAASQMVSEAVLAQDVLVGGIAGVGEGQEMSTGLGGTSMLPLQEPINLRNTRFESFSEFPVMTEESPEEMFRMSLEEIRNPDGHGSMFEDDQKEMMLELLDRNSDTESDIMEQPENLDDLVIDIKNPPPISISESNFNMESEEILGTYYQDNFSFDNPSIASFMVDDDTEYDEVIYDQSENKKEEFSLNNFVVKVAADALKSTEMWNVEGSESFQNTYSNYISEREEAKEIVTLMIEIVFEEVFLRSILPCHTSQVEESIENIQDANNNIEVPSQDSVLPTKPPLGLIGSSSSSQLKFDLNRSEIFADDDPSDDLDCSETVQPPPVGIMAGMDMVLCPVTGLLVPAD